MKFILFCLLTLVLNTATFGESYQLDFSVKDITSSKGTNFITDRNIAISSVELIELETRATLPSKPDDLGKIIKVIDKLIAVGKKIWKIVEDGKPVYTEDLAVIHVLPNVEGDYVSFYDMELWSIPKIKSYKLVYKNGFGKPVVSFKFSVLYQYGGKYEGKGNYLTGIKIIPSSVVVNWGFRFDAKSSLITIANIGTKDDPVASATISVEFKAESPFKTIESAMVFHISGKGDLILLQ